ncbi:hypothetical protein C7G41_36445 [Bradyrhizobium sp. MOS002]|nr:hypothetical protein C7G41_36445 [Bradyrhizobium sp. MOS002]
MATERLSRLQISSRIGDCAASAPVAALAWIVVSAARIECAGLKDIIVVISRRLMPSEMLRR